ncbi:MAG: SMC-Scp complex subunit ScpB [Candidatus Methanomethylophilaceae archaeon]
MDVKGAVEAALFSSAGSLRLSEIALKTDIPEEEVRYAVMDLRKEYDSRNSAITIAKFGSEYRMMLRSEYADFTGMFSRAEMSGGTMRTLSTIAYNQPVLQSELSRVLGSRTYDDVRELIERGFVSGRKEGQTLELRTTQKFKEYFGITGSGKEAIKKWIDSQAKNAPSDGTQETE